MTQSSVPGLRAGEYREFDQEIFPSGGVRFLPGGMTVALGQLGKIEFRSPITGALQGTITGPSEKGGISAWAVSPAGDRILWGARSGPVQLVDLSGSEVLGLELPPDAESYLTSESPGLGTFGSVIHTDGTTEDHSTRLPAYRTADDVAFLDGGRRAVIGYGQAYVLVWDLESGQLLHAIGREGPPGEPIRIYRITAVEHGRRLATRDTERVLRVLELGNAEDGEEPREIFSVRLRHDPYEDAIDRPKDMPEHSSLFGRLGAIAFTPDGKRIAAGDGVDIRVWDIRTGEELASWKGHGDRHPILGRHRPLPRITYISFSADGRRALTVGVDATIRVWDPESGEQIWADRPDPCCIDYADISGDGRYVFWTACPGMRLYGVG